MRIARIVTDDGVVIPIDSIKVLDVTERQRIIITVDHNAMSDPETLGRFAEFMYKLFKPAITVVLFNNINVTVVENYSIQ